MKKGQELIEQAIEKGYVEGVKVKALANIGHAGTYLSERGYHYDESRDILTKGGVVIYREGKWAEIVIENPSKTFLVRTSELILGGNYIRTADCCKLADIYTNHAKFTKEIIQLWMIFPMDEEGNFLTEPEEYQMWLAADEGSFFSEREGWEKEAIAYTKAMSRVYYKADGFRLENEEKLLKLVVSNGNKNIYFVAADKQPLTKECVEILAELPCEIELTPAGVSQYIREEVGHEV